MALLTCLAPLFFLFLCIPQCTLGANITNKDIIFRHTSNQCADVSDAGRLSSEPHIILYSCGNQANQKWFVLEGSVPGSFRFGTELEKKLDDTTCCISAPPKIGDPMTAKHCNGEDQSHLSFRMLKVFDKNAFMLQNVATEACATPKGQDLVSAPCDWNDDQQHFVQCRGDKDHCPTP